MYLLMADILLHLADGTICPTVHVMSIQYNIQGQNSKA